MMIMMFLTRSRGVKRLCHVLMKFSRRWKTICRRKDFAFSQMLYAKNNFRLSRVQSIRTKYVTDSIFFTLLLLRSPAGAVAKYCNERVSVCVCLSASISPEPHVRSLNIFCACCLSPWLGPPPAEWRNPKGRGNFGGFSSILTMHCMGRMAVWISLQKTYLA